MAVYYYNDTDVMINVGDEVVGCGIRDNRDLDGMRGRVLSVCSYSDEYDIYVRFTGGCYGTFDWYVCVEDIQPAYSIVHGESPTRCRCCGEPLTADMVLGARLFSRGGICDNCVIDRIGTINPYHFGKELKYALAKDKITIGIEQEIDDSRDEGCRDAVIDGVIHYAVSHKYPLIFSHERDGSLGGEGFESVSAPLTIDEWKSDAVLGQLNALFEYAEDNGFCFDESDNAGLHVHIGRKDLCGTDRAKSDAVGLLMGWAVSRLWDNGFRELSRRDNLDYCRLYKGSRGLFDCAAMHDRYSAVNIENNKTIELRIFKGASCVDEVLIAVDVCYMLAKWATKKINAFEKRKSYSAMCKKYDDCLEYADRLTWSALVKYSKFPDVTIPAMRECGINV